MIGKLLGLLKGGSVTMYKLIAVGLLISILSFGVKHYYNAYHNEVSVNAVLTSKNSELIDKIKNDNIALANLATAAQARADTAKVAIANAQKESKEWQKKATAILLIPQSDKDTCISANVLFDSFIKGDKK